MATKATPKTINEYISQFPKPVGKMLEQIRQTARKAAPDAEEVISYGIPTLMVGGKGWNKYLVHFAAYKKHVSLFGLSSAAMKPFKKELAPYLTPKGALQFAFDEPLPLTLIGKVVKERAKIEYARAKKEKTG